MYTNKLTMPILGSKYYNSLGLNKVIRGGGASNEQWVAQPDGATQYWQLSGPIAIDSNSLIKLSFLGGVPSNRYSRFLVSSASYVGVGGDVSTFDTGGVNTGETKVNNQVIQKGVTQVPESGLNVLNFAIFGSATIETIGAAASGSNKMSLPLLNFEVWQDGVIIHHIPLTNKSQGATQLATVGNVNAFMPNYTDAVWRKP